MNCLCRRTYWHWAARYEVAVWGSFLDAAFYRLRWRSSQMFIGAYGETVRTIITIRDRGENSLGRRPSIVDMMQDSKRIYEALSYMLNIE